MNSRDTASDSLAGTVKGPGERPHEYLFITADNRRARIGELPAVEAFELAGLAKSRGEARRLLESGGAYVGNRRVDPDTILSPEHLTAGSVVVLRAGKRSFALLRFAG